ncbi:ion channel protein [Hamadaea tsunoensis]|uniref:ion channel protein n=1 Tax=Hamadaea tsunoensis TaxID=53368 RepID=UPI000412AE43|nr:ion channel protein [Hamadaea tsunoensis]
MTAAAAPVRSTARRLLATAPAALVVGVVSSLVLLLLTYVADKIEHVLWDGREAWWWRIILLTVTGAAVGLVVVFLPGHAGPDPAKEGLGGPPVPVGLVPTILLAAVLALAGGVSLGPENPITMANVALACAVGVRLTGKDSVQGWMGLAIAGTVGALFGTPVGAALLLSEMIGGDRKQPLWDKLFAPLVAAGAGALTTDVLNAPTMSVSLPPYDTFHFADLLTSSVVGMAGALLGLGLVYAFPYAYRLFEKVPNALPRLVAGGFVLGLLGAVGGMITLFKGEEQMGQLVSGAAGYTTAGLLLILAVKTVALLTAASCGFRGGRIFPGAFIGVALGLFAQRLIPSMPLAVAVASALLGVTIAITQQGWLSFFLAVAIVQDMKLIPLLCITILPVWLLVTGKPEMIIPPSPPARAEPLAAAAGRPEAPG